MPDQSAPDASPNPVRRERHRARRRWITATGALIVIGASLTLWVRGPGGTNTPQPSAPIDAAAAFAEQVEQIASQRRDTLRVTRYAVDDAMLEQLRGLDHLQTVILDRGVITDRGAEVLAELPKLRYLRLRHSPITDRGLRRLAQNDSLWYLNLPQSQCTAEGVAALAEIPKLRQLRIGSDRLGNEVSRAVASIDTLRGIHLIGVPVTDEGVKTIARLPHLESLYLDDSAVTDAGWQWVLENAPQLHVHIDQQHHDRDPQAHPHHE